MNLAAPTKDEKSRVAELKALGLLNGDPDPALDLITQTARRLFGTPVAVIALLDETRQWCKSAAGLDTKTMPRAMSICADAIQSPEGPMVIQDARLDPRFADNPFVADGGVVFYAGHPIRGPDGSALGTLCVLDSKPRTWAEEERRDLEGLARWVEAEIALRSLGLHDIRGLGVVVPGRVTPLERARFWHISRDMFCLADEAGRLLDHNGRICRLLGYPESAMRGRSLITIVHPDDRDKTQRFLADPDAAARSKPFINRVRRAGGTYFYLEWTLAVDGPIKYAVARDVTQREQATLALETMNRALAESNQDLRGFASFTAHELRSPVRAMANSAALLHRKLAGGDEGDLGWAVTLAGAARRMDALIQSMLALAKVNTDETPHAIIEAETIIASTMAAIADSAPDADIEWPALATMYGNPGQVAQLFAHLVMNATKYHAEGVRPVVTISARRVRDRIAFDVTDNGIGIPEGHEEEIFEPMTRLHSRDRFDGTGIGLALCRKIVEHHGGTIVARNAVCGGARFTFDLPAAPTTGARGAASAAR